MRSRHRLPTIFSLSMLDVLCCGLGAVIFLMILYSWDARRQSRALATKSQALEAESKALAAARERVESTSQDRDEKQTTLVNVQQELKATRAALVDAQAEIKRHEADLAKARATSADLTTRLQTAEKANAEALADLKQTRRALALKNEEHSAVQSEAAMLLLDLAKEKTRLETTQDALAAARRSLMSSESRLTATDKQRAEAEVLAMLVPGLRLQVAAAERRVKDLEADSIIHNRQVLALQDRLTATEKQKATLEGDMKLLTKQSDETSSRAVATQKQLDNLKTEMGTLRRQVGEEQVSAGVLRRQLADAEGRFAGVDLGGKRVVLLIDMSGSMGLIEGDKAAPNKWPEVCKTVGQVLGSLPQVEKFQVILFSNSVRYPLGRPGEWLDVDRARSPVEVRDTLLKIKPEGDTNLYAAFEAAFSLKPQGLDTIYLFSDGLPNTGPGMPNPPPKEENAIEAALGKHLRGAITNQWNRGPTKVRIHSVGFFYDSPNLGAFLWSLSRENGGSFVGMNRP